MSTISVVMKQNFLEYASYVIIDRAIPDLRDGCKPVQRRILHTLWNMDDGRFHKVANIVGDCMKLHPHGDTSIEDALVVLANKGLAVGQESLGYFIEKQGNFGNLLTGDGAAAARYIEARLTPLARDTIFNPALTTFLPSYDARNEEPEFLPAKVPVVLLLGTEGIAVGMATTILPHNFGELLEAQIRILEQESSEGAKPVRLRLLPDFPQGGLMDASEYDDGKGRIKLRAKIEQDGDKTVVIRELPFGTNTETLMASIESAVSKGKVKLSEINDRTRDQVEIVLSLSRGAHADEVIPQLYAYTDCEVAVNSNIVIIHGQKPAEMTVSQILRLSTQQLTQQIKAELEFELNQLITKQHHLTLEQIFIENRVYKRIENAKSEQAVQQAVFNGMEPFKKDFVRDMTQEDVDRLLELRIKRISQYDIDKNRRDIDDILRAIKECKAKLKDLVGTTIAWIRSIHTKYAKLFPRRTKVKSMEEIDKKAVANANIRLGYDVATGFFGSAVKAGDREIKCSEYDKIIAIMQNGVYKIMSPVEKTILEGKIQRLEIFDPEQGLTLVVIYRDRQKIPWAKKVHIQGFIKDKEYELIKERAGRIDYLSTKEVGTATCQMVPAPRQRVNEETYDLSQLTVGGATSRGVRIAERPTAKITVQGAE